MSTVEFITFQKYNDKAYAFELGVILKENNIEYIIEESPLRFTPTLVANELEKEFTIKIKKDDFLKAEKIQEDIILKQLDSIDEEYYLLHFTDEELIEIVTKRYEWGQFDFLLAQKLLKDRGKEINPEVVELLKKQRLEEMLKPEQSESAWIIAGYIFATLGGLIGLFIGLHLYTHKKTLPNGDVVKAYSESDRKHGIIIVFVGSISLIISLALRFSEIIH